MSDQSDHIEQSARQTALRRLAFLNSNPEPAFDRFTMMLAKLVNVPVAAISVIDERKHYFKSQVGLEEPAASAREVPISHSFCKHVIHSGEALTIPDATAHPLVCDNPAIQDLKVAAYAGVPLVTSDGTVLGSICMIDTQPRGWTAEELDILNDLAISVSTVLDLRKTVLDLEESRQREEQLREKVSEMQIMIDESRRNKSVNEIVNTEFFDSLSKQAQEMKQRKTNRFSRLDLSSDSAEQKG